MPKQWLFPCIIIRTTDEEQKPAPEGRGYIRLDESEQLFIRIEDAPEVPVGGGGGTPTAIDDGTGNTRVSTGDLGSTIQLTVGGVVVGTINPATINFNTLGTAAFLSGGSMQISASGAMTINATGGYQMTGIAVGSLPNVILIDGAGNLRQGVLSTLVDGLVSSYIDRHSASNNTPADNATTTPATYLTLNFNVPAENDGATYRLAGYYMWAHDDQTGSNFLGEIILDGSDVLVGQTTEPKDPSLDQENPFGYADFRTLSSGAHTLVIEFAATAGSTSRIHQGTLSAERWS